MVIFLKKPICSLAYLEIKSKEVSFWQNQLKTEGFPYDYSKQNTVYMKTVPVKKEKGEEKEALVESEFKVSFSFDGNEFRFAHALSSTNLRLTVAFVSTNSRVVVGKWPNVLKEVEYDYL